MSAIDQINANGQDYDIMSPEVVSDYVEKLGTICKNPNGYTKGSLFLARDAQDVERMYKATAIISSNQTITVGTNCTHKKLGDLFNDVDSEVGNVRQALTNEVVTRASLGAHNILDISSGVISGDGDCTFAFTEDGVIANGSGPKYYNVDFTSAITADIKYSICPDGGSDEKYRAQLYNVTDNLWEPRVYNSQWHNWHLDKGKSYRLYISVLGTVSNLLWQPMIRLATDTDPTYQPYAMTNRELTDVAQQVQNKFVSYGLASVSVTTDGTKTYATLFNELHAALKTWCNSNLETNDDYIDLNRLYIQGVTTMYAPIGRIVNKSGMNSNPNIGISGYTTEAGHALYSSYGVIRNASSVFFTSDAKTDGTIIVNDATNSVPAASKLIELNFTVFKKIS